MVKTEKMEMQFLRFGKGTVKVTNSDALLHISFQFSQLTGESPI
jgi:hypothetical protein